MRVQHIALTVLLFILVHDAADACLFPSDLNGTWYSSEQGSLTISNYNATHSSIASYTTTKFGVVSLTCYSSSGSNYVFKSSSFQYYGLNFELFACFKISTQISSSKYIYYMGSEENVDADNDRLKTFLVNAAATPSVADVCDRTSYSAGTEHIFLKNDGNEADSKISFPFAWRGEWSYNYTSGSTSYCASSSKVDICSASDITTMTYDYTQCSTVQAYSASGVLYCMYYTSDSQYTYIHVYNTDTTTDESTTYRFTCYTISASGSLIYATQNPQKCSSSQTSTSVATPGATVVYTNIIVCPYDQESSVLSMASAAGIAVGIIIFFIIVICAVLIWYYYKKRKDEKKALDKLPLQKSQPANKRLANGDLMFRDAKSRELRDSKTPRTMNGDVRLNMDSAMDSSIRRENSIVISMTSRGGSGMGPLDEPRIGPAPVEEPEMVNTITESENEETEIALASTFLPITPAENNKLNFTDKDIKDIEMKTAREEEEEESSEDEFDMDDVDDELGMPRLSRAFTPPVPPEQPTLPALAYKKQQEDLAVEQAGDDRTAAGVLKVKLKKHVKQKKARAKSSKAKAAARSQSVLSKKADTPFLERIKKQEVEKSEMEQRQQLEKEMKEIENEVLKARLAKSVKGTRTATGNKYLVDGARDKRLRSSDKGSGQATSGDQRRRFGDPPTAENTRKNRKRTPRLRHPMEVQADGDNSPEQAEGLKKADDFWKEEKRARSGRRREHPEGVTIPSLKEDPFDHRDTHRPETTPSFSKAHGEKPTSGLRLEREGSAFISPQTDPLADDNVWGKASNMWHFKNQPHYGNLGHM